MIAVVAGLGWPAVASAYTLTGSHWTTSTISMQLQLGSTSGTLLDGFTSWGASAEDALTTWNNTIARTKFSVVRDSTAPRAEGNGWNNVFFSADVYGSAWGSGVLAVTLTYYNGSSSFESDVLVNSNYAWNSYRGALRTSATTGGSIYDFHRVVMHEFGHVLGLDHPDQAGQTVSALMNSRISSLDTLAADDITGAQSIYGAPATTTSTPPTNTTTTSTSSPPTTTTSTPPPATTSPPPTTTASPPPTAPAPALPAITSAPTSRTANAGDPVTFSVTATSSSTLSYQWRKNSTAIGGATSAVLAWASVTPGDAGVYDVVVTNAGGAVTSPAAVLTVNLAPPSIVTAPVGQAVLAGSDVTFAVAATGTALSYQWRKDNVVLAGGTAATFGLSRVQPADAGVYSVTVANASGSVTSGPAALVVNMLPALTAGPADQTVTLGSRTTFTAKATGAPAPTYQWRKDGIDLAGATNAILIFDPTQAGDAGRYAVRVTNVAGSVTSADATLAVLAAPVLTQPPVAQTAPAGNTVTLTAAATGLPAPAYQWRKSGVNLAGATSATLTLADVQPADAGDYTVVVRNSAGSSESGAATVTVKFSRLVNLSARAFVPAGATLTPGFYIRGSSPKQLLLRAVGPTLASFGITAAVPATRLDVFAPGTATALLSNERWGGSAALSTLFPRVGAFPLASDSADSAVDATLLTRGYTARVAADVADTAGVALAEIYDADAPSTHSRLVNLSTLGFAGSGEQALTAGFVVDGNVSKRVLIRGIGPSLAGFGVADPVPDPQLRVVPANSAFAVAVNDDWGGTPELTTAFSQSGAFMLPVDSKDAAVMVTLEPGAYTVLMVGAGGATGTALIELYDLDP